MDSVSSIVVLPLAVLQLAACVSLQVRHLGLHKNGTPHDLASSIAPPQSSVQYTWTATATHYNSTQAGTPICPGTATYCGAPSDGSQFWVGGVCKCGGSDPNCTHGYCYDCNGANECRSECPQCPTDVCGRNFKITCIDPHGDGYCKYTGAQVTMTVTNACPQHNPCNTCKSPNPCRNGYNHIDLCDTTFDAIAIRSKQPAAGILIGVDPA